MSYLPSSILDFLHTPVSLAKLELVLISLPQIKPFRSAIGERLTREALIVKWYTADGIIGYGECSCRPDPFYSHEFVDGAINVIQAYIYPLLREAKTYGQVLKVLKKVRGWPFTRAAVEFAMNDAIRRTTGIGMLEVWNRPRLERVPVGISLGLFDNGDRMQDAMQLAMAEGYQRLKFKISPTYTHSFVFMHIASCVHPNITFDANGSFDENNFEVLAQFMELGNVIEQPFAPGSFYLKKIFDSTHKNLVVCLDEEIETLGQLIEHKENFFELNIKPGRVGGLLHTVELMEFCFRHSIPAWIGGMFETGIGRALNLQIASFFIDAPAHDQSPSSRYFKKDVLIQPIEMDAGYVASSYFKYPQIDEKSISELTLKLIK